MTQATTPERHEVVPVNLWSPLLRKLKAAGPASATGRQWAGTLRNLRSKGVSATEIEWSGIVPLLERHADARITRAEIEAFLSRRPPCAPLLQRCVIAPFSPAVRYEKLPRPEKLPPTGIRNGQRQIRVLRYRDRSFGLHVWLHIEADRGLFGRHHYWSFTVKSGGKVLPTYVPGVEFATAREAMAFGRQVVAEMARQLREAGFVGPSEAVNAFPEYTLPMGAFYTEWWLTLPNLREDFWSDHFPVRNLVAHIRTKERETFFGRFLVIEEIQSDWNQGRRELLRQRSAEGTGGTETDPFDDEIPPANPYETQWVELALRAMVLLAVERRLDGIAWLPGRFHAERFPNADADGLAVFYDRIVLKAVEGLAACFAVRIDDLAFPTATRRFRTRRDHRQGNWRVIERATGQSTSDPFPDAESAERHRQTLEKPDIARLPSLLFSDAMRDDLARNGLPWLGAVGQRIAR